MFVLKSDPTHMVELVTDKNYERISTSPRWCQPKLGDFVSWETYAYGEGGYVGYKTEDVLYRKGIYSACQSVNNDQIQRILDGEKEDDVFMEKDEYER